MADTKPADTKTPAAVAQLGEMVRYTLTEGDVRRLDNDRLTSLAYGNLPHAGDTVPAIVVAVDRETINLHALMDGNDRLWVANVEHGDGYGKWYRPDAA